ncbi:hypothetical protein JOD29_000569 [Lysinibacillus composti]|nr:hypothetical protein [Lysinibacillus composti]MBM7607332.1 hypothetical protein [Lysinibacillus composti]
MWVLTVFEQDTFRIFEFDNQNEATMAIKNFKQPTILTFTM